MNPNLAFSGDLAANSDRESLPWMPMPGYVILSLAAVILTGCADHMALENPHTGMTVLCSGTQSVFNPWSQTTACTASHEAQGWIRSGQK
jgi:hypothetical protein